MVSLNSLAYKQYLSECIDLAICFSTSIGVYFFSSVKMLSIPFQYIMPFVYFLYGLLVIFFSNGRSIGDIKAKITLVRINTGKASKTMYFFRLIIKTSILALISNIQNLDILSMIIIFLMILPIGLKTNGLMVYSLLSLGTRSTFVEYPMLRDKE